MFTLAYHKILCILYITTYGDQRMIIDGKNSMGIRVSASVDDVLWQLFVLLAGSPVAARKEVRNCMALLPITKMSEKVRHYILYRVARPSLVRQFLGSEAQMDIEEF